MQGGQGFRLLLQDFVSLRATGHNSFRRLLFEGNVTHSSELRAREIRCPPCASDRLEFISLGKVILEPERA